MSSVWHVKKSDGKRLGPVSLTELQGWARAGRIGPNDWLSVDGFNWREADSFSPLEMTCRVRQPGVRLGPVHVRYLAELLLSGEVRPVDPAEDLRTGEKSSALKIALRGLIDAEARLRGQESPTSTARPDEPALKPEIDVVTPLQEEMQRQQEELQAQWAKERNELQEQLRLAEERLKEIQQKNELDSSANALQSHETDAVREQVRQAEEALQASMTENQRLRTDLDRLEQMARQWLERSKEAQEKQAKIERERDLAVQAVDGVQGRYDALLRKWEKEKSGWDELQAKLETTERLAAERIQRAEDQVKAWREKYEQSRQQKPAATATAADSTVSPLGKLDEAHIRLKVAISEKQRLEEECARLRRRLASYEQK